MLNIHALRYDNINFRKTLFYVSSEGQAGIIASDFTDFIGVIVALPYWLSILKFSGNGNLIEMLRAMPILERDYISSTPEIVEGRRFNS